MLYSHLLGGSHAFPAKQLQVTVTGKTVIKPVLIMRPFEKGSLYRGKVTEG